MKELKKHSLDSSKVGSENPESQNFRMFQDDGDYGPVSLPEIEIWPSGHGSSSDSDSWNSSGINPDTGGNLGGNIKETCKRTSMMSKVYRISFILLCFLIPAMQSCKQNAKKEISAERLMEIHKRDSVKLSLTPMLNNRDFEHVLPSIDSLIAEYPDDPQLYFVEGWVYDMQGDSILARTAYTKSCSIYDSLIAANPNISDMVNRAYIVQILYGMDAYNRALDDMLSFVGSSRDSLWINDMRETVFKKEELSFCGLSNDTTLKNR